uniref:(northern house mosquito) hypothetical protein n=1 Tax=Culex pipiens TaxID=7175 RepID=A0A8D8A3F9_CULPI
MENHFSRHFPINLQRVFPLPLKPYIVIRVFFSKPLLPIRGTPCFFRTVYTFLTVLKHPPELNLLKNEKKTCYCRDTNTLLLDSIPLVLLLFVFLSKNRSYNKRKKQKRTVVVLQKQDLS